jgi:hypothetical protein
MISLSCSFLPAICYLFWPTYVGWMLYAIGAGHCTIYMANASISLVDPSSALCAPSHVCPDYISLPKAAMADLAPLRCWSTATATTKLRDSCSACAASKVKCTKEKPSCSRCAKRGTTCDYLVTKRPGRKQPPPANDHSSTPPSTNAIHVFDTFSCSTTPLWGYTPTSSASPAASVQHHPTTTNNILPSSSELYHDLSPVESAFFSDLGPMSTDFGDFFA